MKLFLKSRGSGGSRRRQITGLAVAASLILPTGLVAAAGLAVSPASAQISHPATGGSSYTPITPCRLADTRQNSGLQGQGNTLTAGHSLNVMLAGHNCGVPDFNTWKQHAITAVVVNITAINPTEAGWLKASANGQPAPATSTVNFLAGETIANEATITVGADITGENGSIDITNFTGSTDVAVDVQGYYHANPNERAASFYSLTPFRVLDTRVLSGEQGQGETISAGTQISFYPGTRSFLPWATPVPIDATAVVLNVTATNNTAPGFLTLWAANGSQPLASDLNWPSAGTTIPNRVIVPIDHITGMVTIYSNVATDVVVDVNGYFARGTSEDNITGSAYYPLVTSQRIADTRTGLGGNQPLGPGADRVFSVPSDTFGAGPYAPSNFNAVDINTTVTDATDSSFLTVWPGGSPRPWASDNNWVAGSIISNGDLVGTGNLGELNVYNYFGNVDVVIDLFGYFAPFTVSGAPTIGTATVNKVTPGPNKATVSFTAPASIGWCSITSYTVTATDLTTPANGGQFMTGTGSPITVTGLHTGDLYWFTVVATNCVGNSASSAPTNAVTVL